MSFLFSVTISPSINANNLPSQPLEQPLLSTLNTLLATAHFQTRSPTKVHQVLASTSPQTSVLTIQTIQSIQTSLGIPFIPTKSSHPSLPPDLLHVPEQVQDIGRARVDHRLHLELPLAGIPPPSVSLDVHPPPAFTGTLCRHHHQAWTPRRTTRAMAEATLHHSRGNMVQGGLSKAMPQVPTPAPAEEDMRLPLEELPQMH